MDLLLKMKENVSAPEGVPRLFDLIKVQDERMKLAFYAAMGNTLVAKDLDQVAFICPSWLPADCVLDTPFLLDRVRKPLMNIVG